MASLFLIDGDRRLLSSEHRSAANLGEDGSESSATFFLARFRLGGGDGDSVDSETRSMGSESRNTKNIIIQEFHHQTTYRTAR